MKSLGPLFILCLCSSMTLGLRAESEWMAAFAKIDLTPREPVYLAGYASRNKPYESIDTNIHAKALALTDKNGHRALLLTTDLIGFSAAVINPICKAIMDRTGLDRSDILINSSHTHTGPSLTLDPTGPGGERQVDYTKWVQQQMIDLAMDAYEADPEEVEISHGKGVAHFIMNRREWTADRGVRLGVNPSGPVDRSVPVLKIARPGQDGEILGVVFQAACHNTTFGGRHYAINGDYAGYAQEYIESKLPGAQAMFMIGCGGDANPWPKSDPEKDSRKHGRSLGEEVIRVLEDQKRLRSVSGPLTTEFSRPALPLEALPSPAELSRLRLKSGGWRGWAAEQFSKYHDPGAPPFPEIYEAPMAVWQFGDDLTLVGLSGEVVVDYVPLIEKSLGYLNLWISAYCNDVYGYLPSARVLREGGYETRGLYHGIGFFKPEAEKVVVNEIVNLATKAGRKPPALSR